MKAGICKVNITPLIGVWLTGYAGRKLPSQKVHDPLFAKVLVLRHGSARAAIVTCDLIGFNEDSISVIRELAGDKTGIPKTNILVAASHTHAGPATERMRRLGEIDPDYLAFVRKAIAGGIYAASNDLQDVTVGIAKGKVEAIGYIREGSETGKPHPDPELGVIKISDGNGKPLAILVNYACHAVVMGHENLEISADYPGTLQSFVEDNTGAMCFFLQGACGDIDPVLRGTFQKVSRTGRILGAEAVKLAESIDTVKATVLKAKTRTIALPLQRPPSMANIRNEISRAKSKIRRLTKAKASFLEIEVAKTALEWANDSLIALEEKRYPRHCPCEIQIVEIGEAILVAIPGEVFSKLGLSIKRKLGLRRTFIAGYSNGAAAGYIPTKAAFKTAKYAARDVVKWCALAPFTPEVGGIILRETGNLAAFVG